MGDKRFPARRGMITGAVAVMLIGPAVAAHVGGLAWPLDLLASTSKQFGLVTGLLAGGFLIARRWKLLAPAVAAVLLHAAPWDSPRVGRAGADPRTTTTFLQFNVGGFDRQPRHLLETLRQQDADVVVIIEGGQQMLAALQASPALIDAYPGTTFPRRRDPRGWCMVLSRWPTRRLDAEENPVRHVPVAWRADLRVVEQPDQPFLLAVVHPPASRNPWRWDEGNRLVRHLVERLVTVRRDRGLPVVVAADLNAAPASWRSRHLCRAAGLRRCMPRWRLGGTYPSAWPGPLRLAIDDLWVTPDIHLVDWRTSDRTGSDHLAVRVTVGIPRVVRGDETLRVEEQR